MWQSSAMSKLHQGLIVLENNIFFFLLLHVDRRVTVLHNITSSAGNNVLVKQTMLQEFVKTEVQLYQGNLWANLAKTLQRSCLSTQLALLSCVTPCAVQGVHHVCLQMYTCFPYHFQLPGQSFKALPLKDGPRACKIAAKHKFSTNHFIGPTSKYILSVVRCPVT